jgi:hypothetical protein
VFLARLRDAVKASPPEAQDIHLSLTSDAHVHHLANRLHCFSNTTNHQFMERHVWTLKIPSSLTSHVTSLAILVTALSWECLIWWHQAYSSLLLGPTLPDEIYRNLTGPLATQHPVEVAQGATLVHGTPCP